MTQTITINSVTRIEGHARVLIDLADDDTVQNANLIVNELRGFERILIGMEAWRLPQVTARICGVCPTSHQLSSVKAFEAGLGIDPPPAAKLIRILCNLGQLIHSHAAHLFALAGPDLFLGIDSEPASRNIVGLVAANPEFAKKALRLRTLGQKLTELIGGRGIHPVSAVIGGMSWQLKEPDRIELERLATEALALVQEVFTPTKETILKQLEAQPVFKDSFLQQTYYLGTVKDDKVNFYDGRLRLIDPAGATALEFDDRDYDKYLVEKTVDYSYMKPVFFRLNGGEVTYRVNSLARLNVANGYDTPLAQQEFVDFQARFGRPCHLTILHHHARLIELLHACEKALEIARNPAILGPTRAEVTLKSCRCVGHVEAPRGTLIHDYEIDDRGIVRSANLIVATQQNYASINESIKQCVTTFIAGKKDKQVLNAAEFAIRCYDPCLSCATHAWGRMPLTVEIRRAGVTLREARR